MPNKKSKTSGLLNQSLHYLSSTVVSNIISFATLPVFTRYLVPADYGVIALFMLFGGVVVNFNSLGLNSATYRFYFDYYETDPDKFKVMNFTGVATNLFIFLITGVSIYFFGDFIAMHIFKNELGRGLLVLSFVSACLEYFIINLTSFMTARGQARFYSSIIITRVITNTVLSLFFIIFFSMTFMGRIYGLMVSQVLTLLACLCFEYKNFKIKYCFQSLKDAIKFTSPNIASNLISMIYSSIDKPLLNAYRGVGAVGNYDFGQKFAGLFKLVMDAVSLAWVPYFTKMANQNTPESKAKIVGRFYELTFFFMFCGLGISYFSEEIVIVMTTKEYYPSMFIIPIYIFYYVTNIVAFISVNQIWYAKKMVLQLYFSIFQMILTTIFSIIFIKNFGAIGAALAVTSTATVVTIVQIGYANRCYPLNLNYPKMAGIFVLGIVFVLPSYYLMTATLFFLTKILIKLGLLLLFVLVSFRLKYISKASLEEQMAKFPFLARCLSKVCY